MLFISLQFLYVVLHVYYSYILHRCDRTGKSEKVSQIFLALKLELTFKHNICSFLKGCFRRKHWGRWRIWSISWLPRRIQNWLFRPRWLLCSYGNSYVLNTTLIFNPSAAGARDRRLLQAVTKTLQLDRVGFFGCFLSELYSSNITTQLFLYL